MIRFLSILPALAGLGVLATAQTTQIATPQNAMQFFEGPVQHYNLDYATGKLTHLGEMQQVPTNTQAASAPAYVNDCNVSSFTATGTNELIDWGVKAGGLTTLVDSFSFGYATDAVDPSIAGPGATLEVAFYEGATGIGNIGTEVARFSFTGLPGSTTGGIAGFFLTTTLPVGFCLADGPIAYGYCSSDVNTGPILVDVTVCSGNGTIDGFDSWTCPASSGTYIGSFNFMTPNIASFFMVINEDDGTDLATTAVNNGLGGNPVAATDGGTPPVINATWPLSVDPASAGYTMSVGFFGIGSFPAGTLVLAGGQEVIADIASFGPPIEVLQNPPGSNQYPLPIVCDVGLIGLPVTFQGILFGGTVPFALTNGVEAVVGF